MKRTVKFKDAKGNIAIVKVTLKNNESGRPVFSARGEYCGGMGQCLDHIEPKNEAQKLLIDLWKKYHLNDMNAGCEHQRNLKWEDIRINPEELPNCRANRDEKGILAIWVRPEEHKKGMLGRPCIQCGYKYGSAWLYSPLPDNIEEVINETCDLIEEAEEEEKTKNPDISWNDIEDDKIIALGKHLEISPCEAKEDISVSTYDDCVYEYAGQEYLVCTDEEADEKQDEELENYIDECLEIPDNIERYFDREAWKSDARNDGRGHCLNPYDGCEDSEEVNGETYYIYRQN